MSDKPFALPPLPPRPQFHWLEAQLRTWHKAIERRQAIGLTGGKRILYGIARCMVRREIRSGRKVPLLYRFWYSIIGRLVLRTLSARETANSVLLRRIFEHQPDPSYRSDYVIVNFLTATMLLLLGYFSFGTVVESGYMLATYQHTKYTDVTITSHYRDFTSPHQFAVHGKKISPDGQEEELFFEIGPSFWFAEYNPEFLFGKLTDGAVCDLDAYGTLLRIPLALRYLSEGSLYALNPWIVGVRCHMPKAS